MLGDQNLPRDLSHIQILNGHKQRFDGPEKVVLTDLMEFIKVHDPDVILFPYADTWVPLIVKKARHYGLEPTFSRTGWFKQMASKSYWSYGKVNHKDGAMIPISSDSINGSDHQKFVGSEAGCEHNHVYLTVLDPGACLSVFVIHPELFDCFSKRQIPHEVFGRQPV